MAGRAMLPVLVVGLFMAACGGAPSPTNTNGVQRLFSVEPGVAEATKKEILGARTQLINELLGPVKDAQNQKAPSKRAGWLGCVQILGQMRAVEAIPALVEFIEIDETIIQPNRAVVTVPGLDARDKWDDYRRPLSRWATVGALVSIGEPCLPAVMKRLSGASGDTLGACCRVVLELKGKDGAAAPLKEALKAETDLKKRECLKAALDWVAKAPVPDDL
jgi:hypothetical protein